MFIALVLLLGSLLCGVWIASGLFCGSLISGPCGLFALESLSGALVCGLFIDLVSLLGSLLCGFWVALESLLGSLACGMFVETGLFLVAFVSPACERFVALGSLLGSPDRGKFALGSLWGSLAS